MKKAALLLAPGFEEIEALQDRDVQRRQVLNVPAVIVAGCEPHDGWPACRVAGFTLGA